MSPTMKRSAAPACRGRRAALAGLALAAGLPLLGCGAGVVDEDAALRRDGQELLAAVLEGELQLDSGFSGLEFLLVGRPVPGAAETGRHRVHLPRRDNDALAAPRIAAAQVEDDEENGTDQQKLDERLTKPAYERHAS